MLYFAYGSNLSKRAMEARAPRSRPVSGAKLLRHCLVFESNEPPGEPDAFFANVRLHASGIVPGALYEIDASDLEALDAYEDVGRRVYERIVLTVEAANGTRVDAAAYRMDVAGPPRIGLPSPAQLEQIRAGYADWHLDVSILEAALGVSRSGFIPK